VPVGPFRRQSSIVTAHGLCIARNISKAWSRLLTPLPLPNLLNGLSLDRDTPNNQYARQGQWQIQCLNERLVVSSQHIVKPIAAQYTFNVRQTHTWRPREGIGDAAGQGCGMLTLKEATTAMHCRRHQLEATRRWWRCCWPRVRDVNAQGSHYGNALQAAIARGHEKLVETLLARGADVNAQRAWHGNALQAASDRVQEKVVQMLMDAGAYEQ